ncbi:MAG: nucleotidyltransferase family protein [bacterium]
MKKSAFEKDIKKIIDISKNYNVEKIILFGSCVTDVKSAHDIDLAVSGINPKKFFDYYGHISMEAEHEIDLLDLSDIREHLLKRILSAGKVIYER